MATATDDALRAIRESADRHAAQEAAAVQHLLAVKAERERDLAKQYLALHQHMTHGDAGALAPPRPQPRQSPNTARGVGAGASARVQLPPELQAAFEQWQQQISPAYVQQAMAAVAADTKRSAPPPPQSARITRVVSADGVELETWPLPPPTVTRDSKAPHHRTGAVNGSGSSGASRMARPASASTSASASALSATVDRRSARPTAFSVSAVPVPAAPLTARRAPSPGPVAPATRKAPVPQRPASASVQRPTAKSMSAAAVTSAQADAPVNRSAAVATGASAPASAGAPASASTSASASATADAPLMSVAEAERLLAPVGIGYQSPRRKAPTDTSAPVMGLRTPKSVALTDATTYAHDHTKDRPSNGHVNGVSPAKSVRSVAFSGVSGMHVAVSPSGRRSVSLLPRGVSSATDTGPHAHYVSPWRQKKLDEKARRAAMRNQIRADAAAAAEQEQAYAAAVAARAARELDAVADAVRASMAAAAAADRERAAVEARAQAERDAIEARHAYLRAHQSRWGVFVPDAVGQPPLLLYKMCAVWGNRFVDIFDGKTEFTLGASQPIPRDDAGDAVERWHATAFPCYVYATPELAVAERFPDTPPARALFTPANTTATDADADAAAAAAVAEAEGDGVVPAVGGSALLHTPRALLKVVVIGDARDYGGGKYAFAHMKAVEVVLWSSGSRLTTVRGDDGRVIGRERLYDWVAAADSYRPPPTLTRAEAQAKAKAKAKAQGKAKAKAPDAVSVAADELMYVLLQRPALWREFVASHPALFPTVGGKYDAAANAQSQRVVPAPLVAAFERFVAAQQPHTHAQAHAHATAHKRLR